MFRALGIIALSTLLSFGASSPSKKEGSGEPPAPATGAPQETPAPQSAAAAAAAALAETQRIASAEQFASPPPSQRNPHPPGAPRKLTRLFSETETDTDAAASATAASTAPAGGAASSAGSKRRRSVTDDTAAASSAAAVGAPDPAALITSQLSREQLRFLETQDPGVLAIIHSEALTPSRKAEILNAEADRDYSNNSYFPFPKTDADITTRHTHWEKWFIRKTIASLLGDAAATASLEAAIEDRKYYREFIYDMAPEDAPEKGKRAEKFYVDQCRIAGIR
jgi:hypothetical protein